MSLARLIASVAVLAVGTGALAVPAPARAENITVAPGQVAYSSTEYVPGVTYHAIVVGGVRIERTGSPDYELHDAFYCYETNNPDSATNHCVASGTPRDQVVTLGSFYGQGSSTCTQSYACALQLSSSGYGTSHYHLLPYAPNHRYETDFTVGVRGKLRFTNTDYCETGTDRNCVSGGFAVQITQAGTPKGCSAPWAAASRSTPRARRSAINEVHVVSVCPDVQFHKGGTPADAWLPVEKDTILKAGDEISCDPDGEVVLAFADNSTVTVSDTTQLKIGSFFTEGGVVKTVILLKMGQVAAQVNKSEATKSDFRIKSPTAVSSVRGTIFSVFYDPGSRFTQVSTRRGSVRVTPANHKLRAVTVGAGREVALSPRSESRLAAIGKAGLRGGVDVAKARALALEAVAKRATGCKTTTPRSNATSIRQASGGWLVAVKLQGALTGTTRWRIAHAKATPANALARRLAHGCA